MIRYLCYKLIPGMQWVKLLALVLWAIVQQQIWGRRAYPARRAPLDLKDSQTTRQTSSTAENRGQTFHQFYISGRKSEISHPSENQPLIVSQFFEKDIRKEDATKKRETDSE